MIMPLFTLGCLNPSLSQDLASLNPSLGFDLGINFQVLSKSPPGLVRLASTNIDLAFTPGCH